MSINERELLQWIRRRPGQRVAYKQLVHELGLSGGAERRELREQLQALVQRGALLVGEDGAWSLPQTSSAAVPHGMVAGRLDLHRDGFAFVRRESDAQSAAQREDIFIPPTEIHGAMQGDLVLVELDRRSASGRASGRVARVLERRNVTIVGTFHLALKGHRSGAQSASRHPAHDGFWMVPFDSRMTQPIRIPATEPIPDQAWSRKHRVVAGQAETIASYQDLEGWMVDVEITRWPTATRPAEGRILEVLGRPDDFGVDVEIMLRKHQLPRIFPEAVLAEAKAVALPDPPTGDVAELERREDFRAFPIVTIDGESARDFDDAVHVRRLGAGGDAGWELQVHIADVAHYVRPGSALDLEARLRGTSVYFPDRAVPMLPHDLSTGICSLRPQEDRLVLSCILQLDAQANIQGFRLAEGIIRSAARMTYTQVHQILEGDAETRSSFAPLVPLFEQMRELAGRMQQRRQERGSIDFDLPEPVIEFNPEGQMEGVSRAERTWANRLIEEFMLAANECVAIWLEDMPVPALYRIHEQPDPKRVMEFEDAAAAFGYTLGIGALPVKRFQPRTDRREQHRRGSNAREARTIELPEKVDVTPQMYQLLTQRISGNPEERILNHLMLRSLKQARYSEQNTGHFALAAPSYTHFTSPIRRYPDLIIHRITKALLQGGACAERSLSSTRLESPWQTRHRAPVHARDSAPRPVHTVSAPIAEAELAEIARESSQAERRAAEAERELIEWKKVRFMQDRVGEDFHAIVLNPAKYGLFIELEEMFVEGLIPIELLPGDRYSYRENTREIIGNHTGRCFRAGDRLHVFLDRVLAFERKLQFAIVEDEAASSPRRSTSNKSNQKSKRETKQAVHPKFRPPKQALKRGNRKKKQKGRR